MHEDIRALTERVAKRVDFVETLKAEVGKVLVGQDDMLHRLLLGLLAGGHVLLEGVPGLAKTLAVRTLAERASTARSRASSSRPTCCPPTSSARRSTTRARATSRSSSGPVFAQPRPRRRDQPRAREGAVARCSRRCRSARSRSATRRYPLAEPFLVLATQNPIEQEGTYPLPEAQLDRFMLKIKVGYPTQATTSVKIVDRMARHGRRADRAQGDRRATRSSRARDVVAPDLRRRQGQATTSSTSSSATRDPKAAGIAAARDR